MSLNRYRESENQLPSISTLQRVAHHLTALHDALDRPLHVGPFCLSRYCSLAHVVNVKMTIARAEGDLFAILSIPGEFVDRLSSTDGNRRGGSLHARTKSAGAVKYSDRVTHLDIIVQVPQVEFTSAINRPKDGRVFRVPLGVKYVIARFLERTQRSNG